MAVYRCPLCPLVFRYRTEVESHLREEHRSRPSEEADFRAELAQATSTLDCELLRKLRSSRARPSVTLLLATAPAATMTGLDIARLRHLAERARQRLSHEPDREGPTQVVEHRLSKTVAAAETVPTERGLVVMVNQHYLAIVTLPFEPRDRNVTDDCFATRDLEYAMRRFPQYRALVLGRHPRILEGRDGDLSEPPTAPGPPASRAAPGRARTDPVLGGEALLAHRIEAAGALPLVVVGDRRHLEEFMRHSPHAGDVTAKASRSRFGRATSEDLAAKAIRRWLQFQQEQAVAELDRADRQDQIAWGVEAAWEALHTRTAGQLWVEHDFAVPGRILRDVCGVQRTTDPAEPDVVDDLVDTLISKAIQLDVRVDLLDRGTVGRAEPVAARISPRTAEKASPATKVRPEQISPVPSP
jgi:hypothetical protein